MYELIEIGEHMMEKNVSAIDSPEGVVMRVQRDVYIVRKSNFIHNCMCLCLFSFVRSFVCVCVLQGRKNGNKSLNFENELLEKLVWLRARRTGKSEDFCRDEILNATR